MCVVVVVATGGRDECILLVWTPVCSQQCCLGCLMLAGLHCLVLAVLTAFSNDIRCPLKMCGGLRLLHTSSGHAPCKRVEGSVKVFSFLSFLLFLPISLRQPGTQYVEPVYSVLTGDYMYGVETLTVCAQTPQRIGAHTQ